MKKEQAFHGSDLERVEAVYGIKKEEIINFAANVNPLGIPSLVKETLANNLDIITTYPDRNYTNLRESIAQYCHIDASHIVVGNGSTELISMMAQCIHPQKALIIGPTYSEYAREIGLIDAGIDYFELKEEDNFQINLTSLKETLLNNYDLLVICNPNNPTSSAISTENMGHIFSFCKEHGTFVMVDETYVEFAPDINSITCVGLASSYDNFICLRGVSKFYAAPGLRLGYAITSNQDLLDTIHTKQNPWTVSSLAEIAGINMFKDDSFNQKTKRLMHREQERLYKIFNDSGKFKPYKPFANFILLKILDETQTSASIFEACIKQGCMIRDCSSFPFLKDRYIRFCFMNEADNDKLVKLLLNI